MANASLYMRTKIINWLRGTNMPSAPANVYVALFSTPTDSGTGGTEIAVTRQVLTLAADTAGATATTTALVFPSWPAATTATHFAWYDASTSGNRLFFGALATARTTSPGGSVTINAGDMSLTAQ